MSHIDDCPVRRSQHLTRGSLFQNPAAKVYVFDHIRHGMALEILSRASVACRFESPHTAVSDYEWREYFGLPVMSLSAVANYYDLNVSEIEHHIRKKNTDFRNSVPDSESFLHLLSLGLKRLQLHQNRHIC
jgi:hypothetical protein